MSRERAKSRYEADHKAASEENSKFTALRSAELIDPEGNYLPKYFDKVAYSEFQKPEVRKAYGDDYEKFKVQFDKMGDKKFVRTYKAPEDISRDLEKTYDSIATKQAVESNQPTLTGIDKFLMKSASSAINTVGDGVREATNGAIDIQSGADPTAPQDVPEVAKTSPLRAQETGESLGPEEEYVSPTFSPTVKPQTINQIIKGEGGQHYAVFASNKGPKGEFTKINLGVKSDLTANSAPRNIEKVRLFNSETSTYFDAPFDRDQNTSEVLVDGTWLKPDSGISHMPHDVKLIDLEYTDPSTGEEMSAQAYSTVGNATGTNIVRMPDGTTFATTGIPVLLRGKQDQTENKKGAIPNAVKQDLVNFGQQRKTASLASLMLKQDFVSSPTNWIQANLSLFTDMLGATVGATGDRAGDLEAIASFINSEVQDSEELRDSIGILDAAAVRSGQKDAVENFLTFALARSQFGGGKLTVQAVEAAQEVVKPLMNGTDYNRGTLQTVITRSGAEMARIAGSAITLAMGQGETSNIWQHYPRVQQYMAKGLTPVPEKVDGKLLVSDINKMKTSNPDAYSTTLVNLKSTFGEDWEAALQTPIRFSGEFDTIVMPMYKKKDDGSFQFGIFPAK
jgi:hypothetical protein